MKLIVQIWAVISTVVVVTMGYDFGGFDFGPKSDLSLPLLGMIDSLKSGLDIKEISKALKDFESHADRNDFLKVLKQILDKKDTREIEKALHDAKNGNKIAEMLSHLLKGSSFEHQAKQLHAITNKNAETEEAKVEEEKIEEEKKEEEKKEEEKPVKDEPKAKPKPTPKKENKKVTS